MADSKIAVVGALAANVGIAITKFVAAAFSGSSAMLAEGIHSTVDTANSVLLLVGLRRSRLGPTAEHPFGHGKELYFWSLIVAVLIFGVGGGVSAYEGILRIARPTALESAAWSYAVLGVAAVFDGGSLAIAVRTFLRANPDQPFWTALGNSKDPATYTVIAEDSASLIGLAFAALGVFASDALGLWVADGIASVMIGLLLAAVSVMLIRQARGLLVGEGIRGETARAIRAIATDDPRIVDVGPPLSMYIGPDEILLTFDVQFAARTEASEVAAAVRDVERRIRERFPKIRRIYIEAVNLGATERATPQPELAR